MNPKEHPSAFVDRARNILSGALVVSALYGYYAPDRQTPFQTTSIHRQPEKDTASETWHAQSPLERIDALERGVAPAELDSFSELTLATAEFYCQQTKCSQYPKDMARQVVSVDSDWFADKFQASQMPAPYRVPDTITPVEFIDDDIAYINRDALHQAVAEYAHQDLEGRDMRTISEKSLLIHVYSHMTASDETLALQMPLDLTDMHGVVFDRIENLNLVGSNQEGGPVVLNGSKEAMVELAARKISQQTGLHIGLSEAYNNAADALDQILGEAGITDEEFFEYHSGQRSLQEMLDRWTKPVSFPNDAEFLYFLIGMRAENRVPQELLTEYIDDYLNQ